MLATLKALDLELANVTSYGEFLLMQSSLTLSLATLLISAFAVAAENSSSISTMPNSPSVATMNRNYEGSMTFGMLGRTFNDDVVESRFARTVIKFDLDAKFSDWMEAKLSASQLFTTGATSNLYAVTEGNSGLNATTLDEASLAGTLLHLDHVDGVLSAGVLRVDLNPINSILYQGHWMAGAADLDLHNSAGSLHLNATQSTPAATSFSNRLEDGDTLPLLTTGTLQGNWNINSAWTLMAAETGFVFTDPSSQAATDSQKIGSTTTQTGKAFLYDFRGAEAAAAILYSGSQGHKWSLRGSVLNNNLAPAGHNQGMRASMELMLPSAKWDWTSILSAFRTESDAIPATYARPLDGFTNRIGGTVFLKAENRKEKFFLYGAYTRANVLDDVGTQGSISGTQADRDIYSLGAEVKYDIF